MISCSHCGIETPKDHPIPYICPCGKSGHYDSSDRATAIAIQRACAGGPAFPQHGWSTDMEVQQRMQDQGGMTLRDYFAAKAMQGVMAGGATFRGRTAASSDIAMACYTVADAMLAERAK